MKNLLTLIFILISTSAYADPEIELEPSLGETIEERSALSDQLDELSKVLDDNLKTEFDNSNNNLSGSLLNEAQIITINKISTKSKKLTLKLKHEEYFDNISVELLKCWRSPDQYKNDDKALVRIYENKIDEDPKQIFFGWLFASSMSLNTLEHPVYEVFLTKCSGKVIKGKASKEEQLDSN